MSNERHALPNCTGCGESVSPATDRLYAVGCEDVLCMACCLARGGVYDERQDRWVVTPVITDLLRSVEAHDP